MYANERLRLNVSSFLNMLGTFQNPSWHLPCLHSWHPTGFCALGFVSIHWVQNTNLQNRASQWESKAPQSSKPQRRPGRHSPPSPREWGSTALGALGSRAPQLSMLQRRAGRHSPPSPREWGATALGALGSRDHSPLSPRGEQGATVLQAPVLLKPQPEEGPARKLTEVNEKRSIK